MAHQVTLLNGGLALQVYEFVSEIYQLGMRIIALGTVRVAASNVHASRPRV